MTHFFLNIFKPYTHFDGNNSLGGILIPLGLLLIGTVISTVPLFQMYGVLTATLYALASFVILGLLRRWMLGPFAYDYKTSLFSYETNKVPYLPLIVIGGAEVFSIVIPAALWIFTTYSIAHVFLDWKLPS